MTLREHVEWALVRYLRRRGWVVFWLDHCARQCWIDDNQDGQRLPTQERDSCWLALYEAERKAGR